MVLRFGYPLDGALASLELALIFARQGRFEAVSELAGELIAAFRAVGNPTPGDGSIHAASDGKVDRGVAIGGRDRPRSQGFGSRFDFFFAARVAFFLLALLASRRTFLPIS